MMRRRMIKYLLAAARYYRRESDSLRQKANDATDMLDAECYYSFALKDYEFSMKLADIADTFRIW